MAAEDIPALVWRAVAHGARVISFNPGQTQGIGFGADKSEPPWLRAAIALSRQLSANATLIGQLRPGPGVTVSPPRLAAIDAFLLEGPRCWVLVVTNAATRQTEGVVRLPPAVPYALWVSLIDGATLGMLRQTDGPEWKFKLNRGGAAVYVIDKVPDLAR